MHLYGIGHPIVGDLRYGDKVAQRQLPRLMLHAQSVTFRIPSGEQVTVKVPIPESFTAGVERVRKEMNIDNDLNL